MAVIGHEGREMGLCVVVIGDDPRATILQGLIVF